MRLIKRNGTVSGMYGVRCKVSIVISVQGTTAHHARRGDRWRCSSEFCLLAESHRSSQVFGVLPLASAAHPHGPNRNMLTARGHLSSHRTALGGGHPRLTNEHDQEQFNRAADVYLLSSRRRLLLPDPSSTVGDARRLLTPLGDALSIYTLT